MHLRGVRLRQHYHMDVKGKGRKMPSIAISPQTGQICIQEMAGSK
jgi:hypothetical protein